LKLQAEMALDSGRTDEATERVKTMRALAQRAGIIEPCVVPWADTAMSTYLRAGRLDDVEGLAGHLETVSAGWPCRWPRSVAEIGRAGLAEARKEYQEPERHHDEGVRLLEEVGLPLALVRALIGYGVFLRRSGRPAQARAPLGRAVETARVCGATRLEYQALGELHASGGRRGRGRSAELSHQEQRTATLAARGATNAQIAAALAVSVKTVEHYLSSTYAKLGIRSRRELPDADNTFRT
jgi:DNA-binding CsgD family transcriptional regulator